MYTFIVERAGNTDILQFDCEDILEAIERCDIHYDLEAEDFSSLGEPVAITGLQGVWSVSAIDKHGEAVSAYIVRTAMQ